MPQRDYRELFARQREHDRKIAERERQRGSQYRDLLKDFGKDMEQARAKDGGTYKRKYFT